MRCRIISQSRALAHAIRQISRVCRLSLRIPCLRGGTISIVGLGCLHFEKWIFKRLLLEKTLDIEVRHLQQFYGLL